MLSIRKILLVAALFFLLPATDMYAQNFQWANQVGNTNLNPSSIRIDQFGNIYIAGGFSGTTTIGSFTLTAIGKSDAFVVKCNSSRQVVWVKQVTNSGGVYISVDKDGNCYLTGNFSGNVQFDNFPLSASGSTNTFVVKYNAGGITQWAQKIGGDLNVSSGVEVDYAGNAYLTGYFWNKATFDSTSLISYGLADIWFAKYNAKGAIQWAKQAGGAGSEYGTAVSVDASGFSYFCGMFTGTSMFGNTPLTTTHQLECFVARYSPTGELSWVQKANGANGSVEAIAADKDGNCFLVGNFTGSTFFGNHQVSSTQGSRDVFIAKYSSSGVAEWAQKAGGAKSDVGYDIKADAGGNCYVTGYFESNAKFGETTLMNSGYENGFVAKYSFAGSFQWVQQIKSSDIAAGYAIDVDAPGNAYVAGIFSNNATFGSFALSTNAGGSFLTRLSSNANFISGKVIKDLNKNGMLDTGESPVPNAVIQALPGPLYTNTDSSGNYHFYTGTGNFTVSIPNPILYATLSPTSLTVNFSGLGMQNTGNDFALWPQSGTSDVRVTLTSSSTPRPGFTSQYTITYTNAGTIPVSGTVRFEKDSLYNYIASFPNSTAVNGNEYSWPYTNLSPGQSRSITIGLKLPANVALGKILLVKAAIDPVVGDKVPNDNTELLKLTVRGSFDPNDKQVNPEGKTPTAIISSQEPFIYTIRFQNTGTAPAVTVNVRDTLSQQLNVASLEMLSSSHPCTYSITGRGLVEWTFNNINLPDSNRNEAESHGFLKYRIKPKTTLTEGDTILNRAFIYFDFNAPIQTNTALTRISDKADQTLSIKLLPDRYADEAPFSLESLAQASSGLPTSVRIVSGPASLTGNMLSLIGTGKVVLQFSQPGNGSYNPVPDAYVSFLVNKRPQVIAFEPISAKHLGDAPFVLSATASSGLAVSFSIISGPATLEGNRLAINGTGEVKVKAIQTGNSKFLAAEEVQQNFLINKTEQLLDFPAVGMKHFGDNPFVVRATASSGLSVSLAVVSGPATFTGQALTVTGAGEITIEAFQEGNDSYSPVSSKQTFQVLKASQTIAFDSLPDKTFGDEAIQLIALATSSLSVSYSLVSGPATLSGNHLSITGAGLVKVRASQTGDANFLAAEEVERSFIVHRATQVLSFPEPVEKTFGDAPFTLLAAASSGQAVSFSIVTGPATVRDNVLSITGAGTVQVKASQTGNEQFLPVEQQHTFSVRRASQILTFALISKKNVGETFELSATSSTDLPLSFKVVSGPAILSGNELSITGAGNVTVTAIQAGNQNYLPASIEQTFVVKAVLATEPRSAGEIKVFPNPAKDELSILFPTILPSAALVLMDARGCVVLEDKVQLSSTAKVNTSHLSKGLYFLRIIYQQKILSKQVFID